MARIAIGGYSHETNCFVPMRTDYEHYAQGGEFPPLARREEVIERSKGATFGMSGFLDTIDPSHELVPLIWGQGGAGGYITDDCFERIVGEFVGMLSQAMPVDAVYLDLHGAMCSLTYEDAEGEVLRRVRACVGPDIPVVVSLDYHANVSEATVALTDGMAIYLTYPHIDRQGTGSRAARILMRVLEEGIPSGRAIRRIPFLLPLNFQCTLIEPTKGIVDASVAGEGGEILDLCYAAGFPPSDLDECGPSVVCHAYSQEAADEAADQLAAMVIAREDQFAAPLMEPDDAVADAFAHTLRRLSAAGATVVDITLAELAEIPALSAHGGVLGAEAYALHRARIAASGELMDPRVRVRIERGQNLSAADYIDICRARADSRARTDAATAPCGMKPSGQAGSASSSPQPTGVTH